ncbi:MAG: diguanylate cyclase [Planctomycetota bacterium]
MVEDDPACALIVRRRLEMEGLRVIEAGDGRRGLELARRHCPDVVVTDWMMPGLDGPSLCEAIRRDDTLAGTYLIILSNRTERSERIEGLQRGADDYLGKEQNHDELAARVQAGLRIRNLQKELVRRARTDSLTGLLNVEALRSGLDGEIERARRFRHPLTVAMIDLDHFKDINDGAGHLAGDSALRHVARIIAECCRCQDLIGRVGGDEFAVVFLETPVEAAEIVMERILVRLRAEPVVFDGASYALGLSFGLAGLRPDTFESSEDLIRRADAGLYAMKAEHHARTD